MAAAAELKTVIPTKRVPETGKTSYRSKVHPAIRPASWRGPRKLLGIFLTLLFVNLIVQALAAQAQFRLEQRQMQVNALEKRLNLIYLKLAELGSDERIERLAREKLGMHHALPEEIAYLPAERDTPRTMERTEESGSLLFLASLPQVNRTGLGQRFSEWLQGLGRTLAGTGPSDFD